MTTQEIADVLHTTDIFSLVSMDLLLGIIPQLSVQSFGAE